MAGRDVVSPSRAWSSLLELVVMATQLVDCGASVIDLARLRRQGALALWRKRNGFVVDAAKPNGFDRPWSALAAGEGENDSTIISRPLGFARAGCRRRRRPSSRLTRKA
jgi:competence protein ComEC